MGALLTDCRVRGKTMKSVPTPSSTRRQLGRSRLYTRADVPERLSHWHAPRANRWEHILVESGVLVIECLGDDGVTRETMSTDQARWIAPGARWRIVQMDEAASFRLEIHADEAIQPSAPQPRRAELLDAAPVVQVKDEVEFIRLIDNLGAGERYLVRGTFDFSASFDRALAASMGALCWHPLDSVPGGLVALVARSAQPIGLLEYLGRDHAVLEAALSGALSGNAERMIWLRNLLARHLVIEEEMLFPAYLEAGGTRGWVNGLKKEHGYLKQHLEQLSEPESQRRFMLLLEAHDEKEEQIVYPDALLRLGAAGVDLQRRVMSLGVHRVAPAPAD